MADPIKANLTKVLDYATQYDTTTYKPTSTSNFGTDYHKPQISQKPDGVIFRDSYFPNTETDSTVSGPGVRNDEFNKFYFDMIDGIPRKISATKTITKEVSAGGLSGFFGGKKTVTEDIVENITKRDPPSFKHATFDEMFSFLDEHDGTQDLRRAIFSHQDDQLKIKGAKDYLSKLSDYELRKEFSHEMNRSLYHSLTVVDDSHKEGDADTHETYIKRCKELLTDMKAMDIKLDPNYEHHLEWLDRKIKN